jgi:gamma-glutamyl hydrolase
MRKTKRVKTKRVKTKRVKTKRVKKKGVNKEKLLTQKKMRSVNNLVNRLTKSIKQKLVTVGILTAPFISHADSYITSYMGSSYVKWIESAGALVVPLEYNLPKPILLGFLKQLNGIVLIGGSIENKKTHTNKQFLMYEETIQYILNYTKYQNKIGNYYPVWCTCMTFELTAAFAMEKDILKKQKDIYKYLIKEGFDGGNTLHWTKEPSKLKKLFTQEELNKMSKEECVFYTHSLSLKYDSNHIKKFSKYANIVATGLTKENKIKYIAIYELKNMPLYGVQFHPEKIQFEYYNNGYRVPKTDIAIKFSTKLANFFISECRKNSNIWIGGKKFYDFTINDYNIFNKPISARLRHLHKENITDSIGPWGPGVYFFGPTVVPTGKNIIPNPWQLSIGVNNDDNDDNDDNNDDNDDDEYDEYDELELS